MLVLGPISSISVSPSRITHWPNVASHPDPQLRVSLTHSDSGVGACTVFSVSAGRLGIKLAGKDAAFSFSWAREFIELSNYGGMHVCFPIKCEECLSFAWKRVKVTTLHLNCASPCLEKKKILEKVHLSLHCVCVDVRSFSLSISLRVTSLQHLELRP